MKKPNGIIPSLLAIAYRGGVGKFKLKNNWRIFQKSVNFLFKNHISSKKKHKQSTHNEATRTLFGSNSKFGCFTMSRENFQTNSKLVQKKSAHHFRDFLHNQNGYILILVCCFIPIILLGTKWVLDTSTIHSEKPGKIVKKCAREAALKVAQNWNPALSRDQQKESMLRLADEIYNTSPSYNTVTLKYNAIPGLEMPSKIQVTKGGKYDPLKVKVAETVSLSPSSKTVAYREVEVKSGRYMVAAVSNALANRLASLFDAVYNLSNYDSRFILENTIKDLGIQISGSSYYPRFTMYSSNLSELKKVSYNNQVTLEGGETSSKIQTRVNLNDTTVQVTIEGDKIKVQTDEDIGYASPASCNVDIVLGIPVNGAACNIDNLDARTSTAGSPYASSNNTPTADGMKTPIYQVAHAMKEKIVDPLKYTRGVNIGIVPYCGLCSLPLNRLNDWSSNAETFIIDNFVNSDPSKRCDPYISSCFMYGISRRVDPLNYYYSHSGIGAHSWTNVMARKGKMTAETIYGENILHCGDLLSTNDPGGSERADFSPKFMKRPTGRIMGMPGIVNFLSMGFDPGESDAWTWANPYYVVELQSDLLKIGDLLNLFYPFNFNSNQLSNFVFIPVTWANNLFQSWSKDPKYDAVDTSKANTNIDQAGGRLSCPSKTTAGRKKALILVVNKPDWFEPGELTYLGYDNDFSEIPMIESDCIRFDVNYSDTSRKFADGSTYNGTIQGAKKILKFSGTSVSRNATSGYYECDGTGTGTLTFPKKYLVRVVVEPLQKIIWTYKSKGLGQNTGKSNWRQLAYNGSGWMAVNSESYTATSSDALTWSNKTRISEKNQSGIAYANGTYITSSASNWGCYISTDGGNTWVSKGLFGWDGTCDVAYGNGWWFVSNYWATRAFSKDNGANWDTKQDVGKYFGARKDFFVTYSNGIWMALSSVGEIQTTSDLSQENWTSLGNKLGSKSSQWRRICGASKHFVAISSEGITAISRDNGQNWEYANISGGSDWQGLCYGQNKFVACSSDGDIAFSDTRLEGTIEFSSIVTSSNYCTVRSNTITERREFFIEADQINEGSDGNYRLSMKLDNIRLISAGITNRPYQKITPSCSLSGTTNGSGTAYITTNVKGPIKVDAKAAPTEGTITFSSINGTNISNGTYGNDNLQITADKIISFDKATTFNFPANCFGSNYEDKKITYNINDARIVNARLANRYIRVYGTGQADNAAIKNKFSTDKYVNSNDINPFTVCVPFKNLTLVDGPCLSYTHSGACKPYSLSVCLDNNIGANTINWNYKAGYSFHIKLQNSGSGNFLFTSEFTGWKNQGQCTYPPASKTISGLSSSSSDPNFFITCTAAWVSGNNGTGCNYFYCYYSNDYTLNSGITLQDNNICFNCCGDLSLGIEPIVKSSYLKHYSLNGNEVSELIGSNTTKTITISPGEYKYEKQTDISGNITYRITLKLENAQLSNAKMVDTDKTCVYTNLRLPKMSRVVDFSKQNNNNFVYDIAGVEAYADNNYMRVGQYPNGSIGNFGVQWDASLDCWKMVRNPSSDHSSYDHFFMMNLPGDMYMLSDAREIPGNIMSYYNIWTNPTNGSTITYKYEYFGNNQYRSYWSFITHRRIPTEESIFGYSFGTYTTELPLVFAGMTLPINAMLYCGADGSTLHKYAFQTAENSTAWNGNDATQGCKNVTVAALKKLYSDWGSNIRIYVLLYRKQTQYSHPVTTVATNFDYSYITNLAANTSTTGTAAASETKPIYKCIDVSDEAGLNSTLSTISSELKTWAGYTEAKVVE